MDNLAMLKRNTMFEATGAKFGSDDEQICFHHTKENKDVQEAT